MHRLLRSVMNGDRVYGSNVLGLLGVEFIALRSSPYWSPMLGIVFHCVFDCFPGIFLGSYIRFCKSAAAPCFATPENHSCSLRFDFSPRRLTSRYKSSWGEFNATLSLCNHRSSVRVLSDSLSFAAQGNHRINFRSSACGEVARQ